MIARLAKFAAATVVFLAVAFAAGGAFAQARLLTPNVGGNAVLAPNAQTAPLATPRTIPGKGALSISPAQQQSLQAQMGGLGFSCNPIFCGCRGDADCNDMFGTNVCGGRAICIDDYCYCDRSAQRLAPQ